MTSLSLPTHADGVNVTLAELLQYKNEARHFLPPSISIWSQLNGKHRSHKRGRGMDFSEVRPYQPGDDVRSIDWRVSARTGKTHTKLYTEEREQPVMLLVDLSAQMKFGSQLLLKSVQACHLAALLSWIACSQKDRIGAVIYNGISLYECKPTARKQGTLQVLGSLIKSHQEMLKNSEPSQSNQFHQALEHLHRLCPKGSDITLISDFYSLKEQDKKSLSQLIRHNRMQCVRIFDPLEKGDTEFRGSELVADNKQSLWLNFGAETTRNRLAINFSTHQDFVKNLTQSLAIPFFSLSTHLPLLHQFTQFTHSRF